MKIPFVYEYDSSVETIEDVGEKKATIKYKIRECEDASINIVASLCIVVVSIFISYWTLHFAPIIFEDYFYTTSEYWESIPYLSAVPAILILALRYGYYENLKAKYKRLLWKIFDSEKEKIKEKVDDDVFENSIKLSYKYLDEYYSQTRDQAQKGFYVTVFVAVFGALLIASGIIIMYIGKIEPAYVTCAAGVITEFISAIFFYLYNRTITSMSAYHNKLVLSQNISIALKVADSLPEEDKTKSKNLIIEELLKNVNSYLIAPDNNENDKT